MKIRIPMVVSENGNISSSFYRSSDGGEHQDVGLLWDDVPPHIQARLLHVVAEVDIEALFKDATIEGSVIVATQGIDVKGGE